MRKRFIITNLEECFQNGLTFNDLAICEDEFKKETQIQLTSNVTVYNDKLSLPINPGLDVLFHFTNATIDKDKNYLMYYEAEFKELPF